MDKKANEAIKANEKLKFENSLEFKNEDKSSPEDMDNSNKKALKLVFPSPNQSKARSPQSLPTRYDNKKKKKKIESQCGLIHVPLSACTIKSSSILVNCNHKM